MSAAFSELFVSSVCGSQQMYPIRHGVVDEVHRGNAQTNNKKRVIGIGLVSENSIVIMAIGDRPGCQEMGAVLTLQVCFPNCPSCLFVAVSRCT